MIICVLALHSVILVIIIYVVYYIKLTVLIEYKITAVLIQSIILGPIDCSDGVLWSSLVINGVGTGYQSSMRPEANLIK